MPSLYKSRSTELKNWVAKQQILLAERERKPENTWCSPDNKRVLISVVRYKVKVFTLYSKI